MGADSVRRETRRRCLNPAWNRLDRRFRNHPRRLIPPQSGAGVSARVTAVATVRRPAVSETTFPMTDIAMIDPGKRGITAISPPGMAIATMVTGMMATGVTVMGVTVMGVMDTGQTATGAMGRATVRLPA